MAITSPSTANVLKFQTLFTFLSQIKCWLSELKLQNACQDFKQERS